MIKNKEYLYTINKFKEPQVVKDSVAVGLRIAELLDMNPGTDPLHPDMGVGIRQYRYGADILSSLKDRIQTQIETYLPMYQFVSVAVVRAPDKSLNVEVNVDGVVYEYASNANDDPISLNDISLS